MEGGRNAGGQFISSADLEKGLTWLKQIRETAGNKMEILIDAGGRWNLTSSQRILKAIEPYNVIHFEGHSDTLECTTGLCGSCSRDLCTNWSQRNNGHEI